MASGSGSWCVRGADRECIDGGGALFFEGRFIRASVDGRSSSSSWCPGRLYGRVPSGSAIFGLPEGRISTCLLMSGLTHLHSLQPLLPVMAALAVYQMW